MRNKFILIALIVAFSVIVVASEQITFPSSEEPQKIILAESVNGVIVSEHVMSGYLEDHGNFSSLDFERVTRKKPFKKVMKAGSVAPDIKGVIIGEKAYAIHLAYCGNKNECTFIINGVPFTEKKGDSLSLDSAHSLKIKNITLNYCEGLRYCHPDFEAYHRVEVEIEN